MHTMLMSESSILRNIRATDSVLTIVASNATLWLVKAAVKSVSMLYIGFVPYQHIQSLPNPSYFKIF